MARRRGYIPQKTPALFFGEGLSEQGYGRWLNHLASVHSIPVHVRSEKLSGGDPLDLVQQALARYAVISRALDRYRHKALLLDADLRGENSARDAMAEGTARKSGLRLIWQDICHEAFLLRHFPGRETHRPSTQGDALDRLKKVWPGYEKGQDATRYGRVLTLDHLARVRAVETELDAFLVRVGWH